MKVSHIVQYSFTHEFEVPKRYQFFYTKDREEWNGNEKKLAKEWVDRLYDKIPHNLSEVKTIIDCEINYEEIF